MKHAEVLTIYTVLLTYICGAFVGLDNNLILYVCFEQFEVILTTFPLRCEKFVKKNFDIVRKEFETSKCTTCYYLPLR